MNPILIYGLTGDIITLGGSMRHNIKMLESNIGTMQLERRLRLVPPRTEPLGPDIGVIVWLVLCGIAWSVVLLVWVRG